jgi:hypothetical protein
MHFRILREEMSSRCLDVKVVGEPERVSSKFVHGYSALPVRIAA